MSYSCNVEPIDGRLASFKPTDETATWFAVHTTPRHEMAVSRHLTERRIESFLPLYSEMRQWKKSRMVVVQVPLFPSYVFVRVLRSARGSVLSVPGVNSIVGSSREHWPLPDAEIEALRAAVRSGTVRPHEYLGVGERVRITSGVMAGCEGILARIKDDLRVVLSVDALMRSVSVEVAVSEIQSVSAPRRTGTAN